MSALRLDPLDAEDRVQLWQDALGPHTAEVHRAITSVAQQFKFGPRAIAAAAADGGDLWQACRERASRELDELADRIVPRYGWDDIVLPPDVIHDLKAAAAQVRHSALVYGAHGFAKKYPRGRGISVLLSGPSGTGKTMAAEVIASDLGSRSLPHRSLARRVEVHRRDREEFARGLRCGRDERRGAPLRRGRCAVRQAQRGQGQPRPLRQYRGELPACSAWRATAGWRFSRPT